MGSTEDSMRKNYHRAQTISQILFGVHIKRADMTDEQRRAVDRYAHKAYEPTPKARARALNYYYENQEKLNEQNKERYHGKPKTENTNL